MFVAHEVHVPVPFEAARAWLVSVSHDHGLLVRASQHAYHEGISRLDRSGPPGSAPVRPRLDRVRFYDWVTHGESAVLPLRWQAIGYGGGQFPALDANLTLTPAGPRASLLRLDGVYRPPMTTLDPGLDAAALSRLAAGTIHGFVERVASAAAHPAGAAGPQRGRWQPEPRPPAAEAG